MPKFWKKFWKKSPRYAGIDFGSGGIKIAEVSQSSGSPVLVAAGSSAFSSEILLDNREENIKDFAAFLRTAFANAGISTDQVVVGLGTQHTIIREVVFPNMVREELQEAIKWDMEKYVPYEPNTFYYDFDVLGPAQNDQEVRVFLAAAPMAIVDNLVAAVKAAGLTPAAIEPEALAIYRLFLEKADAIVLDIGKQHSTISIYHNHCPAVNRLIAIGGQRFTEVVARVLDLALDEAERLKQNQQGLLQRIDMPADPKPLHTEFRILIGDLVREIRRTIDYFQIQNRGFSADVLYLTGGGSSLDNLSQHLSQEMGMEVRLLDPFQQLTVSASLDSSFLYRLGPQLGTAIGLTLRGGEDA